MIDANHHERFTALRSWDELIGIVEKIVSTNEYDVLIFSNDLHLKVPHIKDCQQKQSIIGQRISVLRTDLQDCPFILKPTSGKNILLKTGGFESF
jgi:hypothetical protein